MVRWSAGLVVVGFACATAWGDEAPADLVGKRGDPAKFVFEGEKTFTASQIAHSLKCDPYFLGASRRESSLATLFETTIARIRAGYSHEGFPDAKVEMAIGPDGEVILVKIAEGERYICGDVRITAPDDFPVEQLRKWLISPQPPEHGFSREIDSPTGKRTQWFNAERHPVGLEGPFWDVGKPAWFNDPERYRPYRSLYVGLRALGYRNPKASLRVDADRDSHQAILVIDLKDVGPRTTIGEIEINGLVRNTRAALLTHLGLREGMVYDTALEDRIQDQFRACGRFLKYRVETESPDVPGPVKLVMNVEEYEPVPPLGEELNEAHQVLLKHADWLATLPARDTELEVWIKLDPCEFEMIVSPQGGAWGQFRIWDEQHQPKVWYEFFGNAEQNVHCLPAERVKVQVPPSRQELGFMISMRPNPGVKRGGDDFLMNLGLGMHGVGGNQTLSTPIMYVSDIHPVAALGYLYSRKATHKIEDGVLKIESDIGLEIDVRDGKLIRVWSASDDLQFQITPRERHEGWSGALEVQRKDFVERVKKYDDWSDPAHVTESGARFLAQACQGLAKDEPRVRFAQRVIKRVAREHGFDSLDRAAAELFRGGEFGDPLDDVAAQDGGSKLYYGFAACMALLPPEHWMRRFSQGQVAFEFARDSAAGADNLEMLHTDEVGPLTRLLSAWLLNFSGRDHSWLMADAIENGFSIEAFRVDMRFLLDERCLPGQLFLATAAELREMPADDVGALLAAMFSNAAERRQFAAGIQLLKSTGDKPLAQALPPLLEALWEHGLRDGVEAALKPFRKKPSPLGN